MSKYFGKSNEGVKTYQTFGLGLSATKSAKNPELSGGKSLKTGTLLAENWKIKTVLN